MMVTLQLQTKLEDRDEIDWLKQIYSSKDDHCPNPSSMMVYLLFHTGGE